MRSFYAARVLSLFFIASPSWYNKGMQQSLLIWYDQTRRDLPWRRTGDPYAIWVSEIMLQQTRAETVIGYWTRFLARFPTVWTLASSDEQAALKAWEGLGYYSRARNLRRCAQVICAEYGGKFPQTAEALIALPGIGAYTAGAVASIAFGQRTPAVDGNVERVISRLIGIREDVGIPSVKRRLRAEAAALVPQDRPGDFNQAMMELGARICQPVPRCENCPIRAFCDAFEAGDADALPIKQRKAPPKRLEVGVALVFLGKRVLVYRREESLLNGVWCFPVFEGAVLPTKVGEKLHNLGIEAAYVERIGEARHVFTHRIWEMTLLRFDAITDTCPEGFRFADAAELSALPLPTAVKSARQAAMDRL
ncbi:MAG: A/G-specific adenine glycosylase [Oscillospiraceae bacterium]|nr:A/G-specific adenine glycosylase [Oscillospiraceae bacterium]